MGYSFYFLTLQGCTCVTLRLSYALCGLMQVTRKLELDICDLEKGTFHTMPVVMQQQSGGVFLFLLFFVVEAQGNMSEYIFLSHLRLPSPFQFGASQGKVWCFGLAWVSQYSALFLLPGCLQESNIPTLVMNSY